MNPGPVGMILDRALTPTMLDTTLRVASEAVDRSEAHALLTVALRDLVSAQEAAGKTKDCLSRVWVSPHPPAQDMIRWAIDNQDLDPDRTVLHLAAILATFPFAGVVASIVGRQLHLDGAVEPLRVRAEAKTLFGDRSTIDVGARKFLTTLRYLGLLAGPSGGPLVVGRQPVVPETLTGWITHALLLTRQLTAVGIDEPTRAFELATVKVENGKVGDYPLLETFAEGSRVVAAVRQQFSSSASQAGRSADSSSNTGGDARGTTPTATTPPQPRPVAHRKGNANEVQQRLPIGDAEA